MWALIALSSIEVAVSIIALVLYLLIYTHRITGIGTKLKLALMLAPDILILVSLFCFLRTMNR